MDCSLCGHPELEPAPKRSKYRADVLVCLKCGWRNVVGLDQSEMAREALEDEEDE